MARPPLTLPPLYAILDVDVVTARGWSPADVCRAWLSAGVQVMQLRAKSLGFGAFLDLADRVVALCREAGAVLIINDRADVAAMCGADGVHVGQDDLSPADVRARLGPDAIVGYSAHTDAQVRAAVSEPVSYIALGPVFGTRTKDTGYDAVGLDALRRAAVAVGASGIPLVAIGGITRERAASVRQAGAGSVAVISDLYSASDLTGVEACARQWLLV